MAEGIMKSLNYIKIKMTNSNTMMMLISFLIGVITCFTLTISFYSISYKYKRNKSSGVNMIASAIDEFQTISNTYEKLYESTLRSCIGERCFNHKYQENNLEILRIGFLNLPESKGDILYKYLKQSIEKLHTKSDIQLISDTHVPAYGYGKNHGWSAIIRVARRPIHHAYDLLSTHNINPTLEVVSGQIRQVLTWHCRLSHVAAHTKLYTVFLDQLLIRPRVELERLYTFIGLQYDINDLIRISDELSAHITREIQLNPHSYILTLGQYNAGIQVLEQELQSSDTFKKWPCRSFYQLGSTSTTSTTTMRGSSGTTTTTSNNNNNNDSHKVSKKGNIIYKLPIIPNKLIADCMSSYVKCSIPYDQHPDY